MAGASRGHSGRWQADLALAANTLIWGSTFVVVKQALTGISPLLFLAFRFSIATVALVLAFRGRWGHQKDTRYSLKAGILTGVLLFAGFVFQTLGLRLTSASKSAFLTGLSIALVPFVGSLVYRTVPHWMDVVGVVIATCGMGLMTLGGGSLELSRGDLLTIGCAFAFAAHIVALGHFSKKVSFERLSVLQVGTAAVLALSGFWWLETPRFRPSAEVWAALIVTGLLATALAFSWQAWAQQYTTATRTAVIFALEPVFAWFTAYLLAGELLSRRAVFGAALILAGILVVELKPARPVPNPSQ